MASKYQFQWRSLGVLEAASAIRNQCKLDVELVPGIGGIFEVKVGGRLAGRIFPPRGCSMSLQWTESTEALDWEELAALYRAAPLGDKTPADLKLVFSNSMFRYFAFEHGKLVAAGRVLADGRDCAYLCDIAVLPSHQGRGLGKEIVSRLVERSQAHRKVILYAVPGRESLYRQLGFRRMRTAMAIFEDQRDAYTRGYLCEI